MNINAYISVNIFFYLTNSQDMQCKYEKSVPNKSRVSLFEPTSERLIVFYRFNALQTCKQICLLVLYAF